MRNYNKNNLYLCCIANYLHYSERKFNLKKGFIYKNNYFSVFLKANKNSFFDLLTGEYYIGGKNPQVKTILKLNIKSNTDNISDRKIFKEASKHYTMIANSYFI